MTPEKCLILASVTFGSVFLCAYSLEQMNKRANFEISIPNICNYLIFGYSTGMIISITKHMLDSN